MERKSAGAYSFHGRSYGKTVSFASLQQFPLRGCSSVDRVLASEAKGRGFDPRQPHHQYMLHASFQDWLAWIVCSPDFRLNHRISQERTHATCDAYGEATADASGA